MAGGQASDLWIRDFFATWNASGCNRYNTDGSGSVSIKRRFTNYTNTCPTTVCQWFGSSSSPSTSACGGSLSIAYQGYKMVGIDVTCENGLGRHVTLPKTFTPYRLYDYIGNVSDSYYTGYPLTTSKLGIISEPIYESTTSFAFYAVALSHGN